MLPLLDIASTATPPAGFEQAGFDDSAWNTGSAAFGTPSPGGGAGTPCPLQSTDQTPSSISTDLLVRRNISIPSGATNVRILISVDNEVIGLFFNGTQLPGMPQVGDCPRRDDYIFDVPAELVQSGVDDQGKPKKNTVVYHLRDEGGEDFFDTRIIANLH